MSIVEERYSLALERSIGTDNSYAVVTPLNPNEIDVEPKWWESSADALIPLFEPGFGSTSTIAVGAVTVGNAMRVSRESALESASEYGRELWERLTTLADALEAESASFSTVRRAAKNLNFKRLEEAGPEATVIALNRLTGDCRPLWLYFLQRSTRVRPAEDLEAVDDAANAWLMWGFRSGLI